MRVIICELSGEPRLDKTITVTRRDTNKKGRMVPTTVDMTVNQNQAARKKWNRMRYGITIPPCTAITNSALYLHSKCLQCKPVLLWQAWWIEQKLIFVRDDWGYPAGLGMFRECHYKFGLGLWTIPPHSKSVVEATNRIIHMESTYKQIEWMSKRICFR